MKGTTFRVAKDGTGDFREIQDAIDHLPSEGGSIWIDIGTYEPFEIIGRTNIRIIGSSAGVAKISTNENKSLIKIKDSGAIYIRNLWEIGPEKVGSVSPSTFTNTVGVGIENSNLVHLWELKIEKCRYGIKLANQI